MATATEQVEQVEQVEEATPDDADPIGPVSDDGWGGVYFQGTTEYAEVGGFTYKRHVLSAAFDDLPDDELDMLAASIREEGLKVPIALDASSEELVVLDGWQRLRACHALELTPVTQAVKVGSSVAAYVMAVNVHRRDVQAKNAAQRCLQAMSLFEIERSAQEKKGRKATKSQVAIAAGISTATVDMVRRALKWDTDNKSDAYEVTLRKGRMSAKKAYDQIIAMEAKTEDAVDDDDDDDDNAPMTEAEEKAHIRKMHASTAGDDKPSDDAVANQLLAEAEADRDTQAQEAQAARREAADWKLRLSAVGDEEESAKQILSLGEEKDVLDTRVSDLQEQLNVMARRLNVAERERDEALSVIEEVKVAIKNGDEAGAREALDMDDEPFT